MPYVAREDGEHFVIPSYREVITAKNTGVLKKEISVLAKNFGSYITLQRKGPIQYEIAFSQEGGYLLGETVWNQLKRPADMIYCEAIPNSTDAILVIVKEGAVYLDGQFPVDSIPEELVIFLTQQNNFDIYTFGDVPISEKPEVGKFSFESTSVRSFTVLDKSLFNELPLLRIFHLAPVNDVLKFYGIGVFPAKKAVIGVVILFVIGFMWTYMTAPKEVVTELIVQQVNPYIGYVEEMTSPPPNEEVALFIDHLRTLFTVPGWEIKDFSYTAGKTTATVTSLGTSIAVLQAWANNNNASVNLSSNTMTVSLSGSLKNRRPPTKIYKLNSVLLSFVDQLAAVYPGNRVKYTPAKRRRGPYARDSVDIRIEKLSPAVIALIGNQLEGYPFIMNQIELSLNKEGMLEGTIKLDIMGE